MQPEDPKDWDRETTHSRLPRRQLMGGLMTAKRPSDAVMRTVTQGNSSSNSSSNKSVILASRITSTPSHDHHNNSSSSSNSSSRRKTVPLLVVSICRPFVAIPRWRAAFGLPSLKEPLYRRQLPAAAPAAAAAVCTAELVSYRNATTSRRQHGECWRPPPTQIKYQKYHSQQQQEQQ